MVDGEDIVFEIIGARQGFVGRVALVVDGAQKLLQFACLFHSGSDSFQFSFTFP